jgi:hypothetical protein
MPESVPETSRQAEAPLEQNAASLAALGHRAELVLEYVDCRHTDHGGLLAQLLEIGDRLANLVVGYDAAETFHLKSSSHVEPSILPRVDWSIAMPEPQPFGN